MKINKFVKITYFIAFIFLSIYACDNNQDQSDFFINKGEISYTGKIDSLKIFPGKNRVKVEGLITSDPKVSEVRVYINNFKDSVVIPIIRTTGIDTLSTIIEGLEENVYNFEVKTFDEDGNGSVSVSKSSETFGERYQASLNNRPIISSSLSNDFNLTINFGTMDLTTGVYETEVVYTDGSDVEQTVIVPIDQSEVIIANYKAGSSFKHRSVFLPKEDAIDVFYTDYVSLKPAIIDYTYLIKNNKIPFEEEASSPSQRFINLKDWTTNDAIKAWNGYGGLDTEDNGSRSINIENPGGTSIINGKIYQTLTLPAGKYIFTVNPRSGDWVSNVNDTDFNYACVAKGTTLPDSNGAALETNPSTLGFKKFVSYNWPPRLDPNEITFILTESTEVSLGLSVTQGLDGGVRWFVIQSFTLVQESN